MNAPVLSDAQIAAILENPQVSDHRSQLGTSPQVYFTAEIPESVQQALQAEWGIPVGSDVPMRWIQGDTPAHVDSGRSAFEQTHLVYLTDSEGEFVVGDASYPITKGAAFAFQHGVRHETRGTGLEPRLLIGPMSEHGFAVGVPAPCFPAGTRILTAEGYKVVESLTTDDKVQTSDGRFVRPALFKFSVAKATKETAPYKIAAGALGPSYPPHDLCLSPLHAIHDTKGVWHIPQVAAKDNDKVTQYGVGEPVTYYHIECPDFFSDNLIAEGAVVESFKGRQGTRDVVYEWVAELKGFRRLPKEERCSVSERGNTLVVY
jgi:hypothetical protein